MIVRYLVVSVWTDKETGEVKAKICPISEGISKSGANYGMTDLENVKIVNLKANVGDILTYRMEAVKESK
jgi:hypothetical protein